MGRSRLLTKIAKDIDTSGNLTADAISSDVTLGGATIYSTRSNLPTSGNTAGDQAYVTGNNRLYIWNGSGWYNIALLNLAPSITSIQDSAGGVSPFSLSTEGVSTTITITAADSDGDPITYEYSADSDFNGLATLSQDSSVFTITPFSQDSASTTSGTITFTATDGVNTASSGIQTFTLNFVSALWDETALSIGTSSTNSLDNDTFIDRSTNAHTVTTSGSPLQTAFHPYLDNWSFKTTDGIAYPADDASFAFGTGDFCVECWIFPTVDTGNQVWLDQRASGAVSTGLSIEANNNLNVYIATTAIILGNTSESALTKNAWNHVAHMRSGTTHSLFVNGTRVATTTNSANYTSQQVTIGCYNPNRASSKSSKGYGWVSNARIVKGSSVYDPSQTSLTVPTEKLTAITNTSLLMAHTNRAKDGSTNDHSITFESKVDAFNPFGQESEYASGENKGSVYITGESTYLDVTGGSWLTLTGDFDFTCWYYPVDIGTDRNFLASTYHSSTAGWAIAVGTSGQMQVNLSGDGNDITSSNGVIKENSWHHIRLCRDSTVNGGRVYIYVDGTQVGSFDTGNSLTYSSTLAIGNLGTNRGGVGPLDGAKGYISDIRLINGTMPTDFTVPTSPVGNTNADLYLPMDNAGIFDKTGNFDITPSGDTATSTTQTKFADTSVSFDGAGGDYLSISTTPFIMCNGGPGTIWTLEAWLYATGYSAYNTIFTNRGTGTSSFWLGLDNNTLTPVFFTGASQGQFSSSLTANTWHHIAVTRQTDGRIKYWLDGSSAGQSSNTIYEFAGTANTIGYSPTQNGLPFVGYIEGFQFTNGAVKYTSNFTPPTQTQGRQYQAES